MYVNSTENGLATFQDGKRYQQRVLHKRCPPPTTTPPSTLCGRFLCCLRVGRCLQQVFSAQHIYRTASGSTAAATVCYILARTANGILQIPTWRFKVYHDCHYCCRIDIVLQALYQATIVINQQKRVGKTRHSTSVNEQRECRTPCAVQTENTRG